MVIFLDALVFERSLFLIELPESMVSVCGFVLFRLFVLFFQLSIVRQTVRSTENECKSERMTREKDNENDDTCTTLQERMKRETEKDSNGVTHDAREDA